MADRDQAARLPQVELAGLTRPVERALEGPGRRDKQGTDLTQILIQDRAPARVADLGDQLADPRPRHTRLGTQQPVDLLLIWIELGGHRRATVDRRAL